MLRKIRGSHGLVLANVIVPEKNLLASDKSEMVKDAGKKMDFIFLKNPSTTQDGNVQEVSLLCLLHGCYWF